LYSFGEFLLPPLHRAQQTNKGMSVNGWTIHSMACQPVFDRKVDKGVQFGKHFPIDEIDITHSQLEVHFGGGEKRFSDRLSSYLWSYVAEKHMKLFLKQFFWFVYFHSHLGCFSLSIFNDINLVGIISSGL
jgi:hypothetical protein